jgi:hypothetical protein
VVPKIILVALMTGAAARAQCDTTEEIPKQAIAKNQAGRENHWLGLKLEGVNCNRDAIGAKIRWSAGGVTRSRLKNPGGSYLSSHDPRLVLGVGSAAKIDWVEIAWPSTRVQRIESPPLDRYIAVKEG